MSKVVKKIFSDYLINNNLISSGDWDELLVESLRSKSDFVSFLVDKGVLSEQDALKIISESLKLRIIDLSSMSVEKDVIEKIPIRIASYYKFIPLEIKNKVITIAVNCPYEVGVQDEIRTHLGYSIEMVLATRADIMDALKSNYGVGAQTMEKITLASKDKQIFRQIKQEKVEDIEDLAEDASVIRLVNEIIFEAYKKRATDIHIEPYRDDVSVRYRVDGVLYDIKVSPDVKNYFAPIISRIKIMCNLDIVEKRLPQDGRAMVKTQEQSLDLRVSTLPTPYGESVVIRILPTKILYSLEKLGLSADYRKILEDLIQKPHGIIFVTGPTGSGKTTTLYACLSKINTRDRKIITLEDPIEYEMDAMTQIQVMPEIGLDFARGLRSVLRHDPDIIMVGEVRDLETAEIAIRVALTGHLIFSTLHTNDAASAITRLVDVGIEPYLVSSSVEAFIAQRLVRVICPSCKFEDKGYPAIFKENMAKELGMGSADTIKIFKANGCDKCNNTGFYGRTAIYEMLIVDEEIKEMIVKRATSQEIKRVAKLKGMRTLFQDGLHKIIQAQTTPEEVLRVVSSEEEVFGGIKGEPKDSESQTDKRVYPRLDSNVNIRYKIIKDRTKALKQEDQSDNFSISSNISAGGLAFTANENLKVNTLLDLQIDLPDKKDPIKCLSKVKWTKGIDQNLFDIGICFLDLTGGERSRLNQYISEGLQES